MNPPCGDRGKEIRVAGFEPATFAHSDALPDCATPGTYAKSLGESCQKCHGD